MLFQNKKMSGGIFALRLPMPPLRPRHGCQGFSSRFYPEVNSGQAIGSRTIACSVAAIRLTRELEGNRQAEPVIVVTVLRRVVVPVRRTAVLSVVEIVAATLDTVSTLYGDGPLSYFRATLLVPLMHFQKFRLGLRPKPLLFPSPLCCATPVVPPSACLHCSLFYLDLRALFLLTGKPGRADQLTGGEPPGGTRNSP